MSREVDERIVKMQFDNSEFEKKASSTISVLDKLREKLSFKNVSSAASNISSALNLSSLGNAVSTISDKFTNLGIVGMTALQNITNQALETGKRVASALTIDPIKTGFSEYETQINAVQTILANTESKGSTLKDVNKSLDELNTYADKTIYNFTEMTRNIGTFTAAGVGLEDSTSAIKGIANLAAVSGSTSQQASTAMYQLSQALASGKVMLQDWNSVVNAGMGGELFQNALKRTAKAMGIVVDESVSFRDSISAKGKNDSWLTSDVLLNTLKQLSGDLSEADLAAQGFTQGQIADIMKLGQTAQDAATKVKTFTQLFDTLTEAAQSGWTQSWEIIIGDFEEAKGLLTTLSDKIGASLNSSANARIQLLQQWSDMGGRKVLIDALNESFKTMSNLIKPISQGFRNVFPKTTAKDLVNITKKLKDFIINLRLGKTQSSNVKNAFTGLFSAIKIGVDLFTAIASGVKKFMTSLGVGSKVITLAGNLGSLVTGIKNTIEATNFFGRLIDSVLTPLSRAFRAVFPRKEISTFQKLRTILTGFIRNFNPLEGQAENLRRTFKGLFSLVHLGVQFIQALAQVFGLLFSKITNGINSGGILGFTASIGDAITSADEWVTSMGGFIGLFNKAMEKMKEAFNKAKEAISGFIKKMQEFFNINPQGAEKVTESIKKPMDKLKGVTDAVTKAFDKIKEVCGAVWAFLKPIFDRIGQFFGKIFNEIKDNFKGFTANDFMKLLQSGALTALFAQLAKMVKTFTKDFSGIGGSIKGLIDGLGKTLASFTSLVKAEALMKIAKAVAVLAASLLVMTLLDGIKLGIATAALTAMFQQIAWIFRGFKKLKTGTLDTAIIADAFYKIAKSVLVMAAAIAILGNMEPGQIFVAAVAITMLLGGLVALVASFKQIVKALDGVKYLDTIMIMESFMELAKIIIVLAAAIRIMAKCPADSILAASIGLVGLLMAMAQVVKMMGELKINLTAIKAIETLGKVLRKFALTIALLGLLPWDVLLKGLGAFVVILAGIAIFMKKANDIKMYGKIGENIESLAKGMLILTVALELLGRMDIWQLAQALGTVAISLVMFGVALKAIKVTDAKTGEAIKDMAKAILILAPGLWILSKIPWWGIITGIVAIASAFTVMGVAAKLLGKHADTIESLSKSMRNLGLGIAAVGVGVILMSAALLVWAAASAGTMAGIKLVAETLLGLIPLLFQKLGEGLVAFIEAIAGSADAIIKALVTLIESALVGLDDVIPDFVKTLTTFISEVLTMLQEHAGEWTQQLLDILFDVLEALAERLPEIVEVAVKLLGDIFLAIGEALRNYAPDQLKSILTGVGIIAAIFIAVQKLSGTIKEALPPLIMMIVMLAAVVGAFYIVSLINTETTKVIAEGISAALISLAGSVKLLSNVPISGAVNGLIGLAIFLGGLVAILAILGGLNQIPGFDWLIGEGSKVLKQLGEAIGGFVGGVVGAFLDSATNSFGAVGQHLTDFWNNAKGFINGMQSMNGTKVLESVGILAGAIIALTAAEILDGIANLLGGGKSFGDFGDQLAAMAPGINDFYTTLRYVNGLELLRLAQAVEAFSRISGGIKEGGLFGWFEGTTDWDKFTEGIKKVGVGLADFWGSVTDENGNLKVDPDGVKKACDAGGYLANLGQQIKTGGLIGLITGVTDWEKFKLGISDLGIALLKFQNSITDKEGKLLLNKSIFDKAKECGTVLSDFGQQIKTGGLVGLIMGDTDWGKFKTGISDLGTGLVNFQNNAKSLDKDLMTTALDALEKIVTISTGIDTTESWWEKMFGDGTTDWTGFGEGMASLGTSLKDFSDNLDGVNNDRLQKGAADLEKLVAVSKTLADAGDDGSKLYGFATNLSLIAGTGFSSFTDAVKNAGPGLETAVNTAYDTVIAGLKGKGSDGEEYGEYKHIGETAIGKFNVGIKNKKDATKNAVTTIFKEVKSTVSANSDYYEIGKNAIQGFINGINYMKENAMAVAALVAGGAANSFGNALQINSPSKVFEEFGMYSDKGYINGLLKYAGAVRGASAQIGDGAVDALRNSILSISSVVDDNMDANPVITPVLDLSEIQNGSQEIDNMLGYGYGYATLGRTAQNMSRTFKRNNPNVDVVNAVNNLGDRLDKLEGAIVGMNIVLDDGTLVGKITPAINKKLGNQVRYAKRGM